MVRENKKTRRCLQENTNISRSSEQLKKYLFLCVINENLQKENYSYEENCPLDASSTLLRQGYTAHLTSKVKMNRTCQKVQ